MADVDVIRVTGGARLAGDVPRGRAPRTRALKLMAAALLAAGPHVLTNVPRITDVAIMAEVLRRLGCEVGPASDAGGAAVIIDVPERARHRGRLRPRPPAARLDLRARPAAGPLRPGPGRATPAATRSAPAASTCTSPGLSGWAPTSPASTASSSPPRRRPARRDDLAGLPERRRHREPADGGGARQGRHGDRQRGPRAGDRRHLRACSPTWAPTSTAPAPPRSSVEGVDRAAPGRPPHRRRPDRRRHLGVRRRDDPRRRDRARRRPGATWRSRWTRSPPPAARSTTGRGRLPGRGWTDRPRAVDVVTLPYPGLRRPTCCRWRSALAAVSEGSSLITENIFDGRFMFVNELVRLGADIRTDGHHAVVRGRERLSGAPVRATDIRAGAGLVIAGLCADGVTEVSHVHHIDRGYPTSNPTCAASASRWSAPPPRRTSSTSNLCPGSSRSPRSLRGVFAVCAGSARVCPWGLRGVFAVCAGLPVGPARGLRGLRGVCAGCPWGLRGSPLVCAGLRGSRPWGSQPRCLSTPPPLSPCPPSPSPSRLRRCRRLRACLCPRTDIGQCPHL